MRLACIALLALVLAPAASEATQQGRIVFDGVRVLREPGLVAYDADGTHPRRLVSAPVSNVVVAPDGGFAYARVAADSVVVSAVLSDGRVIAQGYPRSFSPDGSLLLVQLRLGDYALVDRRSGLTLLTLPEQEPVVGWAGDGLLYENGSELHLLAPGSDRLVARSVATAADVTASSSGFIAYETATELRVVRADGSDDHALASACSPQLAWSPDGTRIACFAGGGISVVGLDGTSRTFAAPVDAGWRLGWSPDSRELAFTTEKGVAVLDAGTGAVRRVAAGGRAARWSPDGRRLAVSFGEGESTAVVRAAGGALDVVARDAHGTWLTDGRLLVQVDRETRDQVATMLPTGRDVRLVPHAFPPQHPSLSPDGSKLVYETLTDGPTSVIVCDADGAHRRIVAHAGTNVTDAAWSPDGRRVAFVDDHGIKLVAPSGGRARLVPHTAGAVNVSWSPDGTQLAYAIYGETTEIDVIGVDGRNRRVVVGKRRPLWTDSGIAWSPDGTRIAFDLAAPVGNGEDDASLAVVNLHSRFITELGNQLQNPAWSPDGSRIAGDFYGGEIHVVDVAKPGRELTLAPGSDPSWWSP